MSTGLGRALIPIVFLASLIFYGFYNEAIPQRDPFTLFQTNKGHQVANSEFHFVEVARKLGITHKHEVYDPSPESMTLYPRNHMNASVSVGDYDNDGLMDIFFTTQKEGRRNYLYRNTGGGHFADVTEEVGLGEDRNVPGNSVAAAFFDFDGDGWSDLYISKVGCHKLFRNIRGHFKDISNETGVDQVCGFSTGVNVFDFNKDGYLDLFITNFFDSGPIHSGKEFNGTTELTSHNRRGGPDFLLQNMAGKEFKNVAPQLGVADTGLGWSAGISDIDGDGFPDIYIANDFGQDRIYKNNKGLSFEDITGTLVGVQPTRNGMNAEFGDVNHTGRPAAYVTNVSKIGNKRGANLMWAISPSGKFQNISFKMGTDRCGFSWGAKFFDANRDGWLDLITTNGFWNAGEKSYWYKWATLDGLPAFLRKDPANHPMTEGTQLAANQPNCLFVRKAGRFTDIAQESGIDDLFEGRGVAIVDLDNDGALDVVIANHNERPTVYKQVPTNQNHWIGFTLSSGKSKNRNAIGAKVQIKTSSFTQTIQLYPANGYASQSDPRAYFGLAGDSSVDLEIEWPDGHRQKVSSLSVDEYHKISEDL